MATIAMLVGSGFAAENVAGVSAKQICGLEGAFGYRFGDRFGGTTLPKDTALFDRGCYQVTPIVAHPLFDTYAVCVSEFDGKVYQFQAAKTFDTKPAPGSRSLSPSQVQSNRQLGKHVLDSLLAELPGTVAAQAKFENKGTEWNLFVDEGVRLAVSNFTGWSATMECRNESMAQSVYRQRIHGVR
jgi:hypothetical protein